MQRRSRDLEQFRKTCCIAAAGGAYSAMCSAMQVAAGGHTLCNHPEPCRTIWHDQQISQSVPDCICRLTILLVSGSLQPAESHDAGKGCVCFGDRSVRFGCCACLARQACCDGLGRPFPVCRGAGMLLGCRTRQLVGGKGAARAGGSIPAAPSGDRGFHTDRDRWRH